MFVRCFFIYLQTDNTILTLLTNLITITNIIMQKTSVYTSADLSPDGKTKEWPLYDLENKRLMVLDEYDIHPSTESEMKIVDWERTYFLTKYYML